MKNRGSNILIALLTVPVLTLSACSDSVKPDTTATTTPPTKQSAAPKSDDAYNEATKMMSDKDKMKDPSYVAGVIVRLNKVDSATHPDAKDTLSTLKTTLNNLAIKQARDTLEKGDIWNAEKPLENAKLFGNPSDPELKKVHDDIDAAQTKEVDADTQDYIQKQQAEDKQKARDAQNLFTADTGHVGIAVGQVKHQDTLENAYFPDGKSEFLLLGVSAKNLSSESEDVNPLHFVLMVGYTAINPDTKTFGLNGYFDAINLPAGAQHSGWLAFAVPKDATSYTLVYDDGFGNTSKKIIYK